MEGERSNGRRVLPATIGIQHLDLGMNFWPRYTEMDSVFRARSDENLRRDLKEGWPENAKTCDLRYDVASLSRQLIIKKEMGAGDVGVALDQITRGKRVHVYVCHEGKAFGFRRMDFDDGEVKIGALYVDAEHCNDLVQLESDWLGDESVKPAWQHLVRVPYFLARLANYSPITTVVHNSDGLLAKRWQDRQIPVWEEKIFRFSGPKQLIGLARANGMVLR